MQMCCSVAQRLGRLLFSGKSLRDGAGYLSSRQHSVHRVLIRSPCPEHDGPELHFFFFFFFFFFLFICIANAQEPAVILR
ncbi:hypothetical protein F2P81_003152 [Scophthalmus maximus]|uniref:Uncharacterized protein n=1 Tax=Scophthalmus maximus TaxID=52904 RepID=A0A6A4TLB2_SCOMX|nr:hypothetical protein F2P81_003152 [Scophthalmus maximus]